MMNQNLNDYFSKIEHLPYDKREPYHATLFENKAALSKLVWDIHSHNACVFYHNKNKNNKKKSTLAETGVAIGKLSPEDSEILHKIFLSCPQREFPPFDFDSYYNYEPREFLHQDMERINDYFEPSEFLFQELQKILNSLKKTIEEECGFYWKVASLRIFRVKPVDKTQGLHLDDQILAIKKLFFYPNGVSEKTGSTQIETKDGGTVIIEGEPGTWALFENSLVYHQAFSSSQASGRPTIEVDIMPVFETDTTLRYSGINSWYPWFPIDEKNKSISLNTKELNFDEVHLRLLQRIAGLCTFNKIDHYRFPVDFKDIEVDLDKLFTPNNLAINNEPAVQENLVAYSSVKPEISELALENNVNSVTVQNEAINFKQSFNQMITKYGFYKLASRLLSESLKHLLKKLNLRRNRYQ